MSRFGSNYILGFGELKDSSESENSETEREREERELREFAETLARQAEEYEGYLSQLARETMTQEEVQPQQPLPNSSVLFNAPPLPLLPAETPTLPVLPLVLPLSLPLHAKPPLEDSSRDNSMVPCTPREEQMRFLLGDEDEPFWWTDQPGGTRAVNGPLVLDFQKEVEKAREPNPPQLPGNSRTSDVSGGVHLASNSNESSLGDAKPQQDDEPPPSPSTQRDPPTLSSSQGLTAAKPLTEESVLNYDLIQSNQLKAILSGTMSVRRKSSQGAAALVRPLRSSSVSSDGSRRLQPPVPKPSLMALADLYNAPEESSTSSTTSTTSATSATSTAGSLNATASLATSSPRSPPSYRAGLSLSSLAVSDKGERTAKAMKERSMSTTSKMNLFQKRISKSRLSVRSVEPALPQALPVLPPHTDPATCRLRVLLESGRILVLVAERFWTLVDAKKAICATGDLDPELVSKVAFKIPGAGWLTNEHETFELLPYFQDADKRKEDAQLMLVRRDGAYYKALKRDEKGIGQLLRAPVAWQQQDDETTSFSQCMARLRCQERQHSQQHLADKYQLNLPIMLGDDPPDRSVIITLLLSSGDSEQRTKKVNVKPDDTADSFLQRTWKYFEENRQGVQFSQSPPSLQTIQQYALVVKGLAVYAAGPVRLFDLEYLQRCVATNTEIVMYLAPRRNLHALTDDSRYLFEAEERFLATDPVVHFDHAVLQSRGPTAEIKSVWDVNLPFAVKIGYVKNLQYFANFGGKQIATIQLSLVYGDVVLWPSTKEDAAKGQAKAEINADGSAIFQQNLSTSVKLCDLPRETKLALSLFISEFKVKKGGEKKEKVKAKATSDAWVNCVIYNYKNELRAGELKLKMWPGSANPFLGTCVSNSMDVRAVELGLQFPKHESLIVFPTEPFEYSPYSVEATPSATDQARLDSIFISHSLKELAKEDYDLLWRYRRAYCMKHARALPKVLLAVPKLDPRAIQDMHRLLGEWPSITPVAALELLDARFPDRRVREYAVNHLATLTNAEVEDYLLQMIQVLKYESYHDSPLSRFLLKRALRNKSLGHYFYWTLKAELHQPQVCERFTLMLDGFLKSGGSAREDIAMQEMIHQNLVDIAYKVKKEKSSPVSLLQQELRDLNKSWPGRVQLMLDPLFLTKGIVVEKCKVMDSKMKPLWLLFQNADPRGEDINVIFKCGDDLRQDMLTIQMFRIFDKQWKKENLDLQLNPYRVIATGGETGMVEVVTKSNTISKIQKQIGGASGAFKDEVIFKWLQKQNETSSDPGMAMRVAVENFTASCAGYCVATYVLGVGDRHNDNIMVKEDGHLFHIDFGHILGNFKDFHGLERERFPFVFTPDFAYVMGEKNYNKFVTFCVQAHQILRNHAQLFLNLFSMMLISGMPELQCVKDILYIVDTLNMSDDKSIKPFEQILAASGSQISTRVNFFIHNLVH